MTIFWRYLKKALKMTIFRAFFPSPPPPPPPPRKKSLKSTNKKFWPYWSNIVKIYPQDVLEFWEIWTETIRNKIYLPSKSSLLEDWKTMIAILYSSIMSIPPFLPPSHFMTIRDLALESANFLPHLIENFLVT